jgi:Protein of unknown function (DUF2971)
MDVWEEHDLLFHYTTQSGLFGILETQTLHATYFPFMNDSTEMFQIKPKLIEMFLPLAKDFFREVAARGPVDKYLIREEGGVDGAAQKRSAEIVGTLYRIVFGLNQKPKFYLPFIVSFCGHKEEYERANGLLSQWRGYGKDSGYAIVFDTKVVSDMRKRELESYLYDYSAMGDVVYDGDEDLFRAQFKELIDAVNLDGSKILRGEKGPYTDLNNAFIKHVPRYKHRGFREEKEIRIVVSPTDDSGIEMMKSSGIYDQQKHKSKKSIKFKETLAPYVTLFDQPGINLPIKRIIVGPHADKAVRRDRLQKYLELKGLGIDVTCSETPLV